MTRKRSTRRKGGAADAPTPEPRRPAGQVQALVDELVWDHGDKVREWPDYAERLAARDLTAEEVTETVFATAVEHMKRRLNRILTWGDPVRDELETGTTRDVWTTKCGRYKVGRMGGPEPRFMAVEVADNVGSKERIIRNDIRNLDAAFDAIETYHRTKHAPDELTTNSSATVAKAEEIGLDRRPVSTLNTNHSPVTRNGVSPQGEKNMATMKVNESKARQMLVAMGLAQAGNAEVWKTERVLKYLKKGPKLTAVDGCTEPEGDHAKLYQEICEALAADKEIELTGGKTKAAKETGKKGAGKATNGNGRHKPHSNNPMSLLDAAAKVLGETKKPLKTPEMIERMAAKKYWTSPGGKTPQATLAAAIYTEIKKKGSESRFTKAEKGSFALSK